MMNFGTVKSGRNKRIDGASSSVTLLRLCNASGRYGDCGKVQQHQNDTAQCCKQPNQNTQIDTLFHLDRAPVKQTAFYLKRGKDVEIIPFVVRKEPAPLAQIQKRETIGSARSSCVGSRVVDNQNKVKTSENFEIRPARVGDVPVVLELIRDLATYERAPDEVTATKEQLTDVLFGERPAAEVLLAFEGQSPVGFAVYFYNFSTWLGRPGLYLEDLFVKPDNRGKGYGRALLIQLAKIARGRDCGRMEWAVLDWNEPAIKFYRSLGAKPMDEWTVFRLTRDGIARLADAADTVATTEQREHD